MARSGFFSAVLASFFILFYVTNIAAQEVNHKLYADNSARGARAAMGLFSNAYGRAMAKDVFGLNPNSFAGRAMTVALASVGYQIWSYDTRTGVRFSPLRINKEWAGYWTGYLTAEGLDLFLGFAKKNKGLKFFMGMTSGVLLTYMITEGEINQRWRYADDVRLTFNTLTINRFSYWVHFVGSGGLYWALSNHTRSAEEALVYSSLLIWLWEVKDGYLRWETLGQIGGDGFSWYDGVAGSMGVLGSYVIDRIIFPFAQKIIHSHQAQNETGRGTASNKKVSFHVYPEPNGTKFRVMVVF